MPGKHGAGAGASAKSVKEANKARLAQIAADQHARIRAAMQKDLNDRAAESARIAALERAKALAKAAKLAEVRRVVAEQNARVQAIVTEVLALRAAHTGVSGINAGNNAVGNTEGGTDSPITIVVPPGIDRSTVIRQMTGVDASDSGLIKFRVSDVLVHAT